MKYFLDSGKIDEIRYAYDNYKIDGVTTNPKHILDSFDNFGFQTEIIAAAIRNGNQIATYAAMSAHIATAGLTVYKDSFEHPFTDKGLKIFGDAWDQTEGN